MKPIARKLAWSTAGLLTLALAGVRPAWADDEPVYGRAQKREWLTLDPF